jgi:DNA-binding MarR family transcriptional regulator
MEEALVTVERAMITIRRRQSRRVLSRLAPAGDQTAFDVLDALEELGRPGTVSDIAAALDVDQPRASRLVARAVEQGLLVRRADQQDGRRTPLAPTELGRAHLAAAHETRQAIFAAAMTGWPEEDRATFARLLTSFTAALSGRS